MLSQCSVLDKYTGSDGTSKKEGRSGAKLLNISSCPLSSTRLILNLIESQSVSVSSRKYVLLSTTLGLLCQKLINVSYNTLYPILKKHV